jgi:3-phytase
MKKMTRFALAMVILVLTALWLLASLAFESDQFSSAAIPVSASVETEPVPSAGDAADDPTIWMHPQDRSLSTIIGTDKDRGLAVYDLAGKELQFLPDGEINNVDLRYGFPLKDQSVALVVGSNATNGSIVIYRVNPHTRMLEDVAAHAVDPSATRHPKRQDDSRWGPYEPGLCMYRSSIDGKYYYFVNSGLGDVEQWELSDNGAGQVDAKQVRVFSVGFQAEGCVADDARGYLYLALEERGIRKYQAEPRAGEKYVVVDKVAAKGPLMPDVEGLAIYDGRDQTGYLIASSQGSNHFIVYTRGGSNDYVQTFTVVAGNKIDEVTSTDGIDTVSAPLGHGFPVGLLVVQDDRNNGHHQNFKLVSWQSIEDALRLPSLPRRVGKQQ